MRDAKQIEEMKKQIDKMEKQIDELIMDLYEMTGTDDFHIIGRRLYELGYRKQSDVVTEVFDELEAQLANVKCFDHQFYIYLLLTMKEIESEYIKGE